MARSVTYKKGLVKKADVAFSKWVRRERICDRCGIAQHPRDAETGRLVKSDETGQLQCAHVRSRRGYRARWEPLNALALCGRCHHWMTDAPVPFTEWLKAVFPQHHAYALLLEMAIEEGRPHPTTDAMLRGIIEQFDQELQRWIDQGKSEPCSTPC